MSADNVAQWGAAVCVWAVALGLLIVSVGLAVVTVVDWWLDAKRRRGL